MMVSLGSNSGLSYMYCLPSTSQSDVMLEALVWGSYVLTAWIRYTI